jgi:hypothetical protein
MPPREVPLRWATRAVLTAALFGLGSSACAAVRAHNGETACATNTDCPNRARNHVCLNGRCEACRITPDCGPGKTCDFHFCHSPADLFSR